MQNNVDNLNKPVSTEIFTNWFEKYTNYLSSSYSYSKDLAETILVGQLPCLCRLGLPGLNDRKLTCIIILAGLRSIQPRGFD